MELIEYPDREVLALGLAGRLASELAETVRMQGAASFSVPGGSTPGPVFDTLSGIDLPWDHIAVFLNDERWVPEDSPRSNTRLLGATSLATGAEVGSVLLDVRRMDQCRAAVEATIARFGADLPRPRAPRAR